MNLADSVSVVTGGASGLGAACVGELVSHGGRVLIVDRDAEKGAALAEEIGDRARFVVADVTDEAAMSTALDEAVSSFGKVDIAVACAGIATAEKTLGRNGPHRLESWKRTLDINLTGSFLLARLAAERMQSNSPGPDGERGAIVLTASVAAFDGQKGQSAYAASKGGVAGMILPMARDLADLGIRVNAIAPGLFMTPMLAGLPEPAQESLASQPLFPKRLGKPEEVASLVRFLIETPYMNATTVRIDGGVRLP